MLARALFIRMQLVSPIVCGEIASVAMPPRRSVDSAGYRKNGGGRNTGAPLRLSRRSVAQKRGSLVPSWVGKLMSILSAQQEWSNGRISIAGLLTIYVAEGHDEKVLMHAAEGHVEKVISDDERSRRTLTSVRR